MPKVMPKRLRPQGRKRLASAIPPSSAGRTWRPDPSSPDNGGSPAGSNGAVARSTRRLRSELPDGTCSKGLAVWGPPPYSRATRGRAGDRADPAVLFSFITCGRAVRFSVRRAVQWTRGCPGTPSICQVYPDRAGGFEEPPQRLSRPDLVHGPPLIARRNDPETRTGSGFQPLPCACREYSTGRKRLTSGREAGHGSADAAPRLRTTS